MLNHYKSSIFLKVLKDDGNGEPKETRVTLTNVRTDMTPAEMKQLIQAFQTLISYQITDAELVQYSHII